MVVRLDAAAKHRRTEQSERVSPSFIADVPGVYVVQLIVSDSQSAASPTGEITVSAPDSSVLGCGSLVSGTIAAPGEVDLYSFTGQAGQIISLALASAGGFATSPSSGSVVLRVFAQSGAAVGSAVVEQPEPVHAASRGRLCGSRQREQPHDDGLVQHQPGMSLPGSEP